MAVSDDVAASVNDQLKDWRPDTAAPKPVAPEARAESGGAGVMGKLGQFGKEATSAVEAGARQGADFVKGAVAGTLMPFIPEGNTPGAKLAAKLLAPSESFMSPDRREAADNPKTFAGKLTSGGFKGVGGMATMPIVGGPAAAVAATRNAVADYIIRLLPNVERNIVSGFGMGEGSEIGSKALGGIVDYFSPGNRVSGEQAGAILGGGVGAQLNVTRVAAMGEAARQGGSALAAIPRAFQAARAKQAAGDTRSLWPIFADEFGSLRAQTRGVIQQFTNANIAAAIRRDIHASTEAENFVRDSKVSGIDQRPWGLPERVMVPALTAIAAERVGKTLEESGGIKTQMERRQGAIADAYNKLEGSAKLPPNEGGIKASGEVFRKITQDKVDALSKEESMVRERFPSLEPSKVFERGEEVRTIRDNLRGQAFEESTKRYQAAEQLADLEGVQIEAGDVRAKGKDILAEFYSHVKPDEVPPVIRSILAATKGEAAAIPKEMPGNIEAFMAADKARAEAKAAEDAGRPLSLKDANDLVTGLGKAAAGYKAAERFTEFNRAKALQEQVLASIEKSPMSEMTKQAYANARNFYRTGYAERFQAGMGKALGKERGGAYEGRETLKSSDIFNAALKDEDTLREWDTTFGNDPRARQLLGEALESNFRKQALDASKTTADLERQVTAFKNKYEAALKRFPDVAEKMDQEGAKVYGLRAEQQAEIERFKYLMGPDAEVGKEIGWTQAKKMFQSALADPDKMQALLKAFPAGKGDAPKHMMKELFLQANPMKNGNYDADALYKIITAGKKDPNMPSSLEMLAKAALGEKEGERHMQVLEALVNFTKREAAVNPQNLRPESLMADEPVLGATGSSLASWVGMFYAKGQGRIGGPFAAAVGMSRFVNAKAQAAVEAAKIRALYDPEEAKAVLEMAATPSTQPIGMTTARKIFGDIRLPNGQKLVDKLLDTGYVRGYIGRGLLYGLEEAKNKSDDKRTVAH